MIVTWLALSAMQVTEPAPVNLSLVIAHTEHQDDPRPIPLGGGDSHFRARFERAQVIAGARLPASFDARLRLHTPLISGTTLALIVERRPDGSLLVLRRAGFNGRNGVACFREPDEPEVRWRPAHPDIRLEGTSLCLFDRAQIDPNAPRD